MGRQGGLTIAFILRGVSALSNQVMGDEQSEADPSDAKASARDVAPAPAQVTFRQEGGALLVSLAGTWALEHPTPRFDRAVDDRPGGFPLESVRFDTAGLGAWDSSLLLFLLQGRDYCEAHDLEFEAASLPESIGRLMELTRAVPEQVLAREAKPPFLARLGARGLSSFDGLMASISFIGEVALGFFRVLTRRGGLRWRDFWVVVQSNSSGALPIVTLISFLVGLIIAFLGAVVLRRLGAGYYVSTLVGYGMLRELGSLMIGIIMAGRTGAAFAAELGSMKITEEIDALRTLGLSPIDHLVLPRVLGIFVTMPVLTVYGMFVGIAGGLLVAVTMLDLTAGQFSSGMLTSLTLSDGLLGVFKAGVFGLIIGLAGCLRGMQTGSDAGAVGKAATSAVVTGITAIIAANAVIDWLAALLQV